MNSGANTWPCASAVHAQRKVRQVRERGQIYSLDKKIAKVTSQIQVSRGYLDDVKGCVRVWWDVSKVCPSDDTHKKKEKQKLLTQEQDSAGQGCCE